MNAVYIKLFRCELKRLEKQGGFHQVVDFLVDCLGRYKNPHIKVVALLEKAKFWFLMGRWDDCLSLLDEVEAYDHLLSPDDKSLFFLLSARLHQGYGDLNQSLSFLEIAAGEAEDGEGYRKIEATLEMASLFQRIGEHERGDDFLQSAKALLEELNHPELESRLSFEYGLVAVRAERLKEAEEYFQNALDALDSQQKPSVARGEGLRFLGILAALDSRPTEALELQRKALQCFTALPYAIGRAKAYNSLGQTCLQLGRYEEAQFFLEEAESICLDIGAEAERAMILGKLGLVFTKNGQYEKAITYQKQDLEISSRFGNFRALAFSLRNLGLSYRAKGDLQNAVSHLRDSRDRFAELEDHAFQVKTDLDLVAALLDHNKVTEAFGFLEDAQSLLEKRMEVTADHVNARYYAGLIALNTENYHRAENLLWQALEMCQAFSMLSRQAEVHFQLANLYGAKKDSEAAVLELLAAYRIARSNSQSSLLYQIVSKLHQIDPDALFEEILSPGYQ
jgi:tetratricopeptide (TPR) repeat protein